MADARHLLNKARKEAMNYLDTYRTPIPAPDMAERIGGYVQSYTLYSAYRPFGVSTVVGVIDENGPALYQIDPSGVYYVRIKSFQGYKACATGKGRQLAKTKLEKLALDQMSLNECLVQAAKIIYESHDEIKDKEFELEMAWAGAETKNQFQQVPKEKVKEVENLAKQSLEQMDED